MAKKDMRSEDKRGQVTIFILLAILIAAVVLLFIFWVQPNYISDTEGRLDLEVCVKDAVEQRIEELAPRAGYFNPEFSYPYLGEEHVYMCYTNLYFVPCTIQQPFPEKFFEAQLQNSLRDEINQCYQNSVGNLREQGYDIVAGTVKYDISLEPGIVGVKIDAPTNVGTQNFRSFNFRINNPMYEILSVATSVVASEAELGDAEVLKYMTLYDNIIVEKLKLGDGTTLYTIRDRHYPNIKYKFASKSLVWPPGYLS